MDIKQFIISKIINSLLVVVIVGGLILWGNYSIKKFIESKNVKHIEEVTKLEQKVSELQRFVDSNVVQAQHTLITKKELDSTVDKLLKENKDLKKYIDANNENIKRIVNAEFTFTNQTGGGKGEISTKSDANGNVAEHYNYSDNYLDFDANILTKLANYKIKLANIPMEVNVVQTELPDGKFKINDYIIVKRTDTGEELHIDKATVQEVLQTEKLFRQNLTSMIGADYGDGLNINVGTAVWSYGRTLAPKDVEYRFCLLGLTGNKDNFGIYVVPTTWNLGRIIPFVQEAQIGVGYSYEFIHQKSLINFGVYHNF